MQVDHQQDGSCEDRDHPTVGPQTSACCTTSSLNYTGSKPAWQPFPVAFSTQVGNDELYSLC